MCFRVGVGEGIFLLKVRIIQVEKPHHQSWTIKKSIKVDEMSSQWNIIHHLIWWCYKVGPTRCLIFPPSSRPPVHWTEKPANVLVGNFRARNFSFVGLFRHVFWYQFGVFSFQIAWFHCVSFPYHSILLVVYYDVVCWIFQSFSSRWIKVTTSLRRCESRFDYCSLQPSWCI